MKTNKRIALLAATAMAFSGAQVMLAGGESDDEGPLFAASTQIVDLDVNTRKVQGELARFVTEVIGNLPETRRGQFQDKWEVIRPVMESSLANSQMSIADIMAFLAPEKETGESDKAYAKRNAEFVNNMYAVASQVAGVSTGWSAYLPDMSTMPKMPAAPKWATMPGKDSLKNIATKKLAAYGAASALTAGCVAMVAIKFGPRVAAKSRGLVGRMALGRNVREYDREQWLDLAFTPAQMVAHPFMLKAILKEKPLASAASLLGMGAVAGLVAVKAAPPVARKAKSGASWTKDKIGSGVSRIRGYRNVKGDDNKGDGSDTEAF